MKKEETNKQNNIPDLFNNTNIIHTKGVNVIR